MSGQSLLAFLRSGSFTQKPHSEAVSATIGALAKAALEVRKLTTQGALNAGFAASRGSSNTDGDIQKDLDVVADGIFLQAIREVPVALYGSEENTGAILIDPAKPLALAIDPLDGSSNIETNVSIGTIFSILPVTGDPKSNSEQAFLQPGTAQLAAGFFIYGPQLALVLTVGTGTRIFIHSSKYGDFIEAYDCVSIPNNASEFAINVSNYRHWEEPIRLYVDDCFAGSEGPREKDFNMRWIASLVADCYRILIRGGVFLYPADKRKGYGSGRIRLVYEANPIAFLVEQADGAATDSVHRILDIQPTSLHQRIPLIFGSKSKVERIARYHVDPEMISERSPLFGNRGLFRV
ncbi:class 1 fructose-bisphosphatase [Hoeflea alexandrii]|mgnify:FL=1|uniref:class 1 fructose-bisphosphatase n=1 Tax=Hoeflea TaxID=274591 RepID=UPI00125C9BD8|nr:class 1 fructose-bisphosphatase [Hoeflea sp. EC-HK425]VVT10075.1 Fructose-1,6-bisphosphatase class 1 [Hoeflea sp. EC-HK425]